MGPFEKIVDEAADPAFARTYKLGIHRMTMAYMRMGFTDAESPGLALEDVQAQLGKLKVKHPTLNPTQLAGLIARWAQGEYDSAVKAIPRK